MPKDSRTTAAVGLWILDFLRVSVTRLLICAELSERAAVKGMTVKLPAIDRSPIHAPDPTCAIIRSLPHMRTWNEFGCRWDWERDVQKCNVFHLSYGFSIRNKNASLVWRLGAVPGGPLPASKQSWKAVDRHKGSLRVGMKKQTSFVVEKITY